MVSNMDITALTGYISPIILIACLAVGYSLHSLNNKLLNSFLPIISATVGVLAAFWSLGTIDLPTIVTGMVSGLASTGLYEALKNILNLPETYAAMAIDIPYGKDKDETIELPTTKGKPSA